MDRADEYLIEIRNMDRFSLIKLWEEHAEKDFDESFWKKGKVLEYVVLRAFELEKEDCVTYPYDVYAGKNEGYNKSIEQIDGAVHVDELYALVECKDYTDNKINIEPLAKMRNQLARRHSAVFGMFFSATQYTSPAEILVGYMAPQLIILWTKEDIEFCLKNGCFIQCMKIKYRRAVENCEYNYAFYMEHTEFEKYESTPPILIVMDETKALYLIVEGKTDAAILHTLLDCRRYQKVYHIPTGGYANISSVVRTIRLMRSPMVSNDKIIVAFDADSLNEQIKNDRIATIRYLTNADIDKRIGVFCFIPTIDQYLFHTNFMNIKSEMGKLIDYLKEHLSELKGMDAIKEIQTFLDE